MLEPVNFAQKIDKVVKLLEKQNIAGQFSSFETPPHQGTY